MNYYPFHIGDYASATRHLDWEEDLAYRRLIDAYYTREQPIPLDRSMAYKLVLATSKKQREAVDSVLREFFKETPEGWRHDRCDYEIDEANAKKKKASGSANARWDVMRTHSERNADAVDSHTIRNAPNPNPNPNIKTEPKTISSGYPPDFEVAWASYPRRPGANKQAAFKAWKARLQKGVDPAVMLEGVKRYADFCAACQTEPRFIKQPATFFGPDEHFLSDWTPPQHGGPPRQPGQRFSAVENYAAQAAQARGEHGKSTDDRIIEGTATVVAG